MTDGCRFLTGRLSSWKEEIDFLLNRIVQFANQSGFLPFFLFGFACLGKFSIKFSVAKGEFIGF